MTQRSFSRRLFLGGAGAFSAVRGLRAEDTDVEQRRAAALQIRKDAALFESELPMPVHPTSGDEQLYPNKIANFSKGLPHNIQGEVDLDAYSALIRAVTTGKPDDFENIPLGTADPRFQRRFTNPQAGLAFDLQGADSHHMAIPAAPAFSSAEQGGEIVELYWQALARDVAFTDYESNPISQAAVADLNKLSDFRGPKSGGRVTAGTLFRGFTAQDLVGPYLSQFLLKPIAYGAQTIDQRILSSAPGVDYLTNYSDWLLMQNGAKPIAANQDDTVIRYVRNGRDLARWVHADVLFQAYFNVGSVVVSAEGIPPNPGNPYQYSRNQDGFGTFGGPHWASAVAEVASRALKAVWYQKWFVHRRQRPEAFAGWVHNRLNGGNYPVHKDVLNSQAVSEVFKKYGTYLLPQAYPEGSPLHPSYGAGHATVAGACVTMLKALFCETYVIPDPVMPSRDGLTLQPYTGPGADNLTVGNELNKLAANIAMARNFAGIHWRSDYAESLKLGEAVAINMLMDQRPTYNENFAGFTFTKFDGTTITV